jgi:1,4-alpha-glucan branching enzyme
MYRDLIHLRRNWYNNTRGLRGQHVNVHHVNHNDKVIAFHRWDNGGSGDDVVVVVNMSSRGFDSYHIGFPRAGLWKVRFNSDWNGYSADFGNHASYDTSAQVGGRDGMAYNGNVGIGPYTAVILSQDS